MSNFHNLKNVTKTVSSFFPRINQNHYLETSLEHTYDEIYYPINSWQSDRFIEFRIPKSVGTFIDLANINVQYELQAQVKVPSDGVYGSNRKAGGGDHFDLINFTGQCIFKHLTIDFNNVQVTNQVNYSLDAFIRLITQFPTEEISKIGKLYHIEKYEKIIKSYSENASYFTNLGVEDPIYKRLLNIRNKGLFLRSPLMGDICQLSNYLIDGIDITIRLLLHDNNFIFSTNQQNPSTGAGGKKYSMNLSDIKLYVKKIKPSVNAYNAFQKTIEPRNGISPTLDYIFTSKTSRQFHIPHGVNEHMIDLPYANTIPEKIFIVFQQYDNFNTRSWDRNGLYLDHLDLINVYITINGSTIFNIDSNFTTGNCAELYNTCLLCLGKNHSLSYDNFKEGLTILAFPLATFDPAGDIRNPYYGNLRIRLTFKDKLADSAVCYLVGDIMSVLSINNNRDIILNKM